MLRKITTLFLAAAVAAFLAVVTAPGVASADPYNPGPEGWSSACAYAPGEATVSACAWFYPKGEWLELRDWDADGWGARAELEWFDSHDGTWGDAPPYTNCFDDTSRGNYGSASTWCNYEVAEDAPVRIHIWLSKGSATCCSDRSQTMHA